MCDRLLAEGHTVLGVDNLLTGSEQNLAPETASFLRSNGTFQYSNIGELRAARSCGTLRNMAADLRPDGGRTTSEATIWRNQTKGGVGSPWNGDYQTADRTPEAVLNHKGRDSLSLFSITLVFVQPIRGSLLNAEVPVVARVRGWRPRGRSCRTRRPVRRS